MRAVGTLLLLTCLVGRATEPVGGPLRFSEVYLCFAEEHAADLVSGFGHAFVCLPEQPAGSTDELLTAPAVNFAADTSGAGEGMWQARFRVRPCHELLRTNTFFQQRDVYFIRLRIDEAGRRRLAEGLSRRMAGPYPYDFLRSNCGAHLAEWILTETGHPGSVPSPRLYLTPREAIESIVDAVGTDGLLLSRSSASRVAARAKDLGPAAIEEARVAVHEPARTSEVRDPWLRLEVIRLNESRVGPESHRELQALRVRTIEGDGGREAAKAMSAADGSTLLPWSTWTRSEEGPAVSLGAIGDSHGTIGMRLAWEAGLREADTAPCNPEARREARLLGLEVDRLGGAYRTKATLAAMHSERNLPGIFGGGSSGFEVGYIDRPNAEGTHGIHLDTWSGLSTRPGESTWVGIRATLRIDDAQADARIRLLPALTASTRLGLISLAGMLVSEQGELGYRIEAHAKPGPEVRLALERAPDRAKRVTASLGARF